MPNQNNFRSDVTTTSDIRYTASRIVRYPEEGILLEEIPGSFGFDREDNIELHFYTITSNQIVLSTIIRAEDGVLKAHVVSYSDGTYKNYIRIDFTKLFVDKGLILIPGDYRMVLNYFSDEVGSYEDKRLSIDTISESRTEVQLTFNNSTDEVIVEENKQLAREFIVKSFEKVDAVGVAEKIFFSGVELDDPTEGINSTNIIENISIPSLNQSYENTISRVERLGIRPQFEESVNSFLQKLYESVREEIVIYGDDRIQQDEYEAVIQKIVTQQIENLRQVVDGRIKIS